MKTNRKLIVCFLSFAVLLGTIPTTSVSAAKKVSLSSKKITITKGTSKTIKVKNTPKPDTTTSPQVSETLVTTTPPTDTQTPPVTANPTNAPAGANEQDIAALEKLIIEQRGRGTTVSEDLGGGAYSRLGIQRYSNFFE